jgi:uncharacterized protein (TIGR02466 family)
MTTLLQAIDPWSPLILKDHFDNLDWSIIKPKCDWLFSQIENNKNSYLEKDGGISSVSLQNSNDTQPHTWAEFSKLQEWLNPRIDEAITRFQLMKQPYKVSNSWINKHPPGSWTDEHCHKGTQLTMAIYLQVPENSGRIVFKDPLEYHWWGDPSDARYEKDGNWYPVNVVEGDVVIFPGWLQHKTEVNNSNEDRYVLTINLMGMVPMRFLV